MAVELQAGDRPIFDFEGSLELAAMMYAAARSLEKIAAVRSAAWEEVLACWEGAVGKHFQDLIDQEVEDLKNTVNTLEVNAQDWANQWATNVDETNDVIRAEAREALKNIRAKADEGFQLHDLDDPFDGDEKKYDQAFDVPVAAPVGIPQAPMFSQPREPFVHYHIVEEGAEIEAYRTFWPAPCPAGSVI